MSTADIGLSSFETISPPLSPSPVNERRAMHRIKQVRREQGCSTRRAAQLLKCDQATVRMEEEETTDLPISRLIEWQKVLEVPLCDLLVEPDSPLSAPVLERARMVRLMKTAVAMQERVTDPTMRRLVVTLVTQLKEIMPELDGVTAWTSLNPRRQQRQYGRVFRDVDRLFDYFNRDT